MSGYEPRRHIFRTAYPAWLHSQLGMGICLHIMSGNMAGGLFASVAGMYLPWVCACGSLYNQASLEPMKPCACCGALNTQASLKLMNPRGAEKGNAAPIATATARPPLEEVRKIGPNTA